MTLDIKNEKPPVRPHKRSTISLTDLIKENRNLKRLLRLVKNHVVYDVDLYEEIMEILNK